MIRRSHLIGVARNPDLEARRCDGHRALDAFQRLAAVESKIVPADLLVGQNLVHVYIRHAGPIFRFCGWEAGHALVSDDTHPNRGPDRIDVAILLDRYRVPVAEALTAHISPDIAPEAR